MKKIFGAAATLALLAGGLATTASAQCGTGVMIKFDADAFAYETAYTPATYHSAPGSVLSIVGHVSYFCAPLAALNPAGPNEYTFYITGLVSAGSAHIPVGPTTFHETDYAGGTWAVYEGNPENAPTDAGGMPALPSALVPASFSDGVVILSGTFSNFHTSVTVQGSNINGSFRADYVATGGSYFGAVGGGSAVFQGNWCVVPEPAGCVPATYSAHPNGKWDTPPTTAVTTSTWGSIKQLYR